MQINSKKLKKMLNILSTVFLLFPMSNVLRLDWGVLICMCLVVSGIEVRYHIMKLYIYIHKYYHESFSNMLKKYKAGYIFFLNYLQTKYRWVGVMFKWHFGFLKISKFLSDMQFFSIRCFSFPAFELTDLMYSEISV